MIKFCSVPGCYSRHLAKGLCQKHYLRMYKNGSLELTIRRDLSAFDRLMLKVERNEQGCLIYKGRLTPKGYVHVRSDNGFMKFGHIIVYEHYYGPMPEGLESDHICNNRACLNYEHIEAVTHAENMRRAVEARDRNWGVGLLPVEERRQFAALGHKVRWSK